jgi:aminopeptidase YwaD
MKRLTLMLFTAVLGSMMLLNGQWNYSYQYGSLPPQILEMIAGESSGERAYQDLIELTGYNRPRPLSEYSGTLFESEYIVSKLKSYGIASAKIERFGKTTTWKGLEGTLWETEPTLSKIADYDGLPLMLASGSNNADVTAPLIWVGEGTVEWLKGAEVKGSILLTSGALSRVFPLAIAAGAHGVVSFESDRPLIDPLQIPTGGVRSTDGKGFAFRVPPRDGHLLRDRLQRGEKIKVRAKVRTTTLDLDIQVPTCVIEGTEKGGDEIIICAHIYEGYVKMGANDNGSGSVAILDVARVLNTMYNDGRLQRPARSIRFIWIPEFSGTIPWVEANMDIMKRTLCNINLDMVGIKMAENQSFLNLHRTTFGMPHYVNDVLQMYMRYISETNKIRCTPVGRFGFLKPMVAPTGTDDPFYWNAEAYLGASDHAVFNNFTVRVPGILLNNWPDHYYHTSNDRPWVCDPTQLKRSIFLTAASAYSIASADGQGAMKIAGEVMGNAAHRMGHQLTIGSDRIASATAASVAGEYRRALYEYEAVSINEIETLMSVEELISGEVDLNKVLGSFTTSLKAQSDAGIKILEQQMVARCKMLGIKPVPVLQTKLEKQLAVMKPAVTPAAMAAGYSGYRPMMEKVPAAFAASHIYSRVRNIHEVILLANGKRSALDIMKMLDSQYPEQCGEEHFMNALAVLKEAGIVSYQ